MWANEQSVNFPFPPSLPSHQKKKRENKKFTKTRGNSTNQENKTKKKKQKKKSLFGSLVHSDKNNNLITPFDVLDGDEFLGLFILHQPRHAEISGPDVADQIVTVAVVHYRHVHARSDRQRRPIHSNNPNRKQK